MYRYGGLYQQLYISIKVAHIDAILIRMQCTYRAKRQNDSTQTFFNNLSPIFISLSKSCKLELVILQLGQYSRVQVSAKIHVTIAKKYL